MDTISRGNAAEAAVIQALVRAGMHVFLPFGDGSACDLVVDIGRELLKVHVKCGRIRGECIAFNSASTDHGRGRMSYLGRADVFGVYAHQIDRVYIVPVDGCAVPEARLRCAPTHNNQQKGIRYGSDYTVESWAASLTLSAT